MSEPAHDIYCPECSMLVEREDGDELACGDCGFVVPECDDSCEECLDAAEEAAPRSPYVVVVEWAWDNGVAVVELEASSPRAARRAALRELIPHADPDNPDEIDAREIVVVAGPRVYG